MQNFLSHVGNGKVGEEGFCMYRQDRMLQKEIESCTSMTIKQSKGLDCLKSSGVCVGLQG